MNEQFSIHILKSKRKSLSMTVNPEGVVIVKAPLRASDKDIAKFVHAHSDWIGKQLKKRAAHPPLTRMYVSGDEFYFLGKKLVLDIGNYKTIEAVENKLQFPKFLQFRIQKELHAWYVHQAKKIITQQVETYTDRMETSYIGLTFSDTKSRWGSCSPENHLQFNWKLVMAPMVVLTYVVIHELAHTKEKNHGPQFWQIVRFHTPAHRAHRKWLNDHGDILKI